VLALRVSLVFSLDPGSFPAAWFFGRRVLLREPVACARRPSAAGPAVNPMHSMGGFGKGSQLASSLSPVVSTRARAFRVVGSKGSRPFLVFCISELLLACRDLFLLRHLLCIALYSGRPTPYSIPNFILTVSLARG